VDRKRQQITNCANSGPHARSSGRFRSRRIAIALFAAALAGSTVTAAQAQLGIDTELSPEAKSNSAPARQWTILGGAEYGGDGELVTETSPTPYDVDFFTTSFSPNYVGDPATEDPGNPEGFFGGAECIEPTPFEDEALKACERRPAIYRYYEDAVGDPHIGKVPIAELLGPTEAEQEEQGFVGAIAWLDDERALAVGGTGEYPRREPDPLTSDEIEPGESYDEAYARKDADPEQGAGTARAWIYDDDDGDALAEPTDTDGINHWRELDDLADDSEGDEIPDQMGALNALDCVPKDRMEFNDGSGRVMVAKGTCWAGGMQQLWSWRADAAPGSSEGFDFGDPVTGGTDGGLSDFHFRVRQIRYDPSPTSSRAAAVTSGCCATLEPASEQDGGGVRGTTGARLLTFDGSAWQTRSLSPLTADDANVPSSPLADSYYAGVFGRNGGDFSAIVSPGGEPTGEASEPGSRIVVNVAPSKAPASPTDALSDLGSAINGITAGATQAGGQAAKSDPATQSLDAIRLQAADGDFSFTRSPISDWETTLDLGDGVLDWAVGRFKSSEQAVAYTTLPSILPLPRPVTCELGILPVLGYFRSQQIPCELARDNFTEHRFDTSSRLVQFPTYALNALSFVPGTAGGEAWAAGDRGALARLGGEGRLGAEQEPPAPELRPGRPTPLSERGSFDPLRPPSAQPGAVPPLVTQPFETLPEETLVSYGTADSSRHRLLAREQIAALTMSRDGSEGWAVGAGSGTRGMALQHFDGERWVRCDPDGLDGAYEADRACASLAALGKENLSLAAIARIPFERDGYPPNDDEFEAIAIGSNTSAGTGATVLAYTGGSWTVDKSAQGIPQGISVHPSHPVADIAFRTPRDGWMVTHEGTGGSNTYHYDGGEWPNGRWVECSVSAPLPECGRDALTLPSGTSVKEIEVEIAGESIFIAGTRSVGLGSTGASYPFAFALDMSATEPRWRAEYDPGESPTPETQGSIESFSAVDLGDGRIAAWMLGMFGEPGASASLQSRSDEVKRPLTGPGHVLIRRDPDSGTWTYREVDDAAESLVPYRDTFETDPQIVSSPGPDGTERSFIMPGNRLGAVSFPPLAYDAESDRWEVMRAPFMSSTSLGGFGSENGSIEAAVKGAVLAAAPDNRGGLWVAVESNFSQATWLYRYTDQRRREVFEDVASPVAAPITDLDGSSDGTVWVSTESDRLHRYDRIGGWETIAIPGWDRGRVVTRPSKALAVAVNDSGVGVAVGEDGRIAEISPEAVSLDPASARRCSDGPPPCGTPRDLFAADVAPDGSAMVGGEGATLSWRPAGGEFRLIAGPRLSTQTRITDIAMPIPGRAWLTTSNGITETSPDRTSTEGEIWAGTQCGESCWRWSRESASEAARDEAGLAALNAVELDSSGRGLAVGRRGAMLERSPDGTWTRLKTDFVDNLYSVELPPAGYGNGDGVLIGAGAGAILTRTEGTFYFARQGDPFGPSTQAGQARIIGVSLAGGDGIGTVDAWAASQANGPWLDPPPYALFHYASPGEPLLQPEVRAESLPDAPESRPGELPLAALGRSECQFGDCPPFQGTNLFNEVVMRSIQVELGERSERSEGPLSALFTGDINSSAGRDEERNSSTGVVGGTIHYPDDQNISHDQWREFFAEPMLEDGIPLFAGVGEEDLSRARICNRGGLGGPTGCYDTQETTDAGTSLQWRESFAEMPEPWGSGEPFTDAGGVSYEPVESDLPYTEAPGGGARTHYALDVVRDEEPLARIVFLDSSVARSIAASEASQNPLEPTTQQTWLEQMLCQEGSAADTAALECTRPEGLPAVVVTTTPTYSYGPGAIEQTMTEGSALESLLLRHKVTALISGRLGWNGLYYTFAPGLHYPQPGGQHPDPENPPTSPSGAESPASPLDHEAPDPQELASGTGATGLLPTIVASSAGGTFGPRGNEQGSAAEGFWHGYSVVRIPADGDPSNVIVEQRPILDWIGITARDHVIGPRQRMTLDGFGREPLGTDTSVRMLEIDSHAITHRYDLLLADPEEPWMPCEEADTACTTLHANLAKDEVSEANPCAPYLCLPRPVGTVDETTGLIRSGDGRYPETFALGMLSVGQKAATWPLVFERSPSFVTRSALRAPGAPQLNNVPTPGAPGQQPPPEVPQIPKIEVPAIPPPPAIPSLSATTPPELTPPTPPAPPPPSQQPAPLDLSVAPPGVSISTPTALIQPPTPPVNPAPPGGARREARQRQAAAQKGGADGDAESGEGESGGTDATDSRTVPATRRDRTKAEPSFTALAASDQPSAWSRGALYGGGLTIAALVLAMGFSTLRPTPRRRQPELPAPAWSRDRHRR
jgi:hypothetical protein